MKKSFAVFAVLLVLLAAMLPGPAWARGGSWHGGHHGGHGGVWLPGAIIGGLVVGAVALVTAPFWALSGALAPAPPAAYAPPVQYIPPPAYPAPSAYVPPPTYQRAPTYAPPQAPVVRREVAYSNGRYVLYGDGAHQPWQWVWIPSTTPPPPPPPPQQQ